MLGGYTPKVSFDTFENPAASMFSFTLSAETVGYTRTLQTRVFLCAASPDESGRQALDWALDSLVQDGDELVVFRGFDEDDLGVCLSLFWSFMVIVVELIPVAVVDWIPADIGLPWK